MVIFVKSLDRGFDYWYIYMLAFWNNPALFLLLEKGLLWATQRDVTSNAVTTAFSGGCRTDGILLSHLANCLLVPIGTDAISTTIWAIRFCRMTRLWCIVDRLAVAVPTVRLVMARCTVIGTGHRRSMAAPVAARRLLRHLELVHVTERLSLHLVTSIVSTSTETRNSVSKNATITTMPMVIWSRTVMPTERSDIIDPSKSINCSHSKKI